MYDVKRAAAVSAVVISLGGMATTTTPPRVRSEVQMRPVDMKMNRVWVGAVSTHGPGPAAEPTWVSEIDVEEFTEADLAMLQHAFTSPVDEVDLSEFYPSDEAL